MKRAEAQFILTAYRPNGEDALDAEFSESLRMAEADPELGKWFAQEQAMDRLIGDKLRSVQPPAGLRDRILMGGRVSRKPAWFSVARWMSLAAALVLFSLLGSYYIHSVSRNQLATFAMNYIGQDFELQVEANDLHKLTTWLADKNMPIPQNMPERLAALEKLGCRTIDYGGHSVSLICFQEGNHEYHLFVLKRTQEPLYATLTGKQIASSGIYSAAMWSDGQNDYVLATESDRASLEQLL